LLRHWSRKSLIIEEKKGADLAKAYAPWFDWFAQRYPDEAAKLQRSSADLGSWKARLSAIGWESGDVDRGKAVFEKQSCHRCHRQSGQLGPDLPPAVSRMSREDLLVAILQPSLEVSPTYQTKTATTKDGKIYNGIVIYESPEGTLLQTGPDTTVRFTAEDAIELQPSAQSLMPTGLLDTLNDGAIADLYAYLKSLAAK
jgi:putative heme-binding domain-containing protein